jgi:hypothetical protein
MSTNFHNYNQHKQRHSSPAENIADIVGSIFGLAAITLHGSARFIRSIYGSVVWGDHPGCNSCYECTHYCDEVECRPQMHNCHHCH